MSCARHDLTDMVLLLNRKMSYFLIKAALSGVLIALVSEVSRRFPGFGGLIASLPLVSVFGMLWLWRETEDPVRMADHATGTFWFVLPSLPMFLLMPALLKRGVGFHTSLLAGCGLTIVLYIVMIWVGQRFGLRL